MPITGLVTEFSLALDLSNRLRSEMFIVNKRLIERDPINTLVDYQKAKATFKEMKVAMGDLERAVHKIKSEIPESVPDFGTDRTS